MTPPEGKTWQGDEGLHLDVRGLLPPGPMVAILWHLTQPGQAGPVIAHLDRDPIYLYSELAEIGWTGRAGRGDAPGEVRLVLERAT